MSKIIYDFLKDSFLYQDKYLFDNFSKFSDSDIKKELNKYRNHILKNIHKLYEEITIYANQIRIFDTSNLIDLTKIKQMSFYLDNVIITDQLFKLTQPINNQQDIFTKFSLGIEKDNNINRNNLVNILKGFKEAEILVESTYLKFFPTSYFFEPNSEIPLISSEKQFSDVLPKNIMNLYYDNTQVRSFSKNGQYLSLNKNFEPDRTIEILFKDDDTKFTNMYDLLEVKIENFNNEKNIANIAMYMPKTKPTQERFDNWVYQSINQSIKSHFNKISSDINLSTQLKAQYITTSPFVDTLLKNQFNMQTDIKTNVSNLMLNFDLKFFENINIKDLMSIRKNDAEEFELFRRELEKQLREIRNEKDISKIKSKIEDVKHELEEVQIASINLKIKKIKNILSKDALIGVAGLGASFATSGLTVFATILSGFHGYKNFTEHQNQIKENPSYFLWKIKKNANI